MYVGAHAVLSTIFEVGGYMYFGTAFAGVI